jgi:hypothetical protein
VRRSTIVSNLMNLVFRVEDFLARRQSIMQERGRNRAGNIKLSRWLRNTGVLERAPVAPKAPKKERRSPGRSIV